MDKKSVLFVDDEEHILNAIKRLVRGQPYVSVFAESGEQALRLMKEQKIQVMVTDITMPEMDGITLLKQVKKHYPHVLGLVLSGISDIDSVLNSINKGNAYRYILKPWNDQELKIIVRQALDLATLQEEKEALTVKLKKYNKDLEEQVHKRTRQLLSIEKHAEIGKHASHIVHNLNGPLQTIFSALTLLEMDLEENNPNNILEKAHEYVHFIESGAMELKDIIAGIMIHARDKKTLSSTKVDINEVIRKSIEFHNMNPLFKHKTKKEINLQDKLPAIHGNPIQLKQIIDNLINNALDAMENVAEKRLEIQTGQEAENIFMTITDSGEGIDPTAMDQIFSPSYTTKPLGKGSGLGLASVKTMIEAYTGSIRVSSRLNEGTRFKIVLPIQSSSLP